MMKASAMNKNKQKETFMQDLFIEMMIHESILKLEKEKLLKKIDEALDMKNHELFNELSKEMKTLMKKFGS